MTKTNAPQQFSTATSRVQRQHDEVGQMRCSLPILRRINQPIRLLM